MHVCLTILDYKSCIICILEGDYKTKQLKILAELGINELGQCILSSQGRTLLQHSALA